MDLRLEHLGALVLGGLATPLLCILFSLLNKMKHTSPAFSRKKRSENI
jgi:hypothetical protein